MHFLSTVLAASCIFAPAFACISDMAVHGDVQQPYWSYGCLFVNVYRDVNSVYTGDQMTCAVYTDCHTLSEADNYGGQVQTDGTVDYIINSAGYCKRKYTVAAEGGQTFLESSIKSGDGDTV
ncbi:hypothetical protein IW261DRAFT_1416165 [Armillaria novae-zelandiae]|uniref:Uncharacterized protein n=1 Tax=Armillaria novae-zelandiae TaxID=153914 RepID=A0AA39PLB1_9AGAR|nr:hypothetical protein IW261DRAFT_1416165 [Armillaria novae-zelandiae]